MRQRDINKIQTIIFLRRLVACLLLLKYLKNLIEEADEQGQANSDYIYLGSTPIARLDEWWEGIETPEAPAGVTVTPGDTQLTVSWDANDEPVDGYKVHYGTQSKNYTTSVDVGKVTNYAITGLTNGITYYVAIKAYANISRLLYYHTDHLGTPIILTDSNGSMVWSGEFLPFGEPLSIIGSVTNNLRFLGQYYDEETGKHNNYFRVYNPITGTYMQRDLIGFRGGINLYSYGNNPVNYRDFYGLEKVLVMYVDQPGSGGDDDAYEGFSDPDVGHTFWKLYDSDKGEYFTEGFYPSTSVNPFTNIEVAGILRDDTGHSYEVSKKFTLTEEQYCAAKEYRDKLKKNPPKYNLNTFNCTDAAEEIAKAAGHPIPNTNCTWPGGSGSCPGKLGQLLR